MNPVFKEFLVKYYMQFVTVPFVLIEGFGRIRIF